MIELVLGLLILALDQATKLVCASWLPTLPGGSYSLIDGVLSLTYVENRGAAFGMLQNARWFFLVITLLVCAFVLYVLIHDHKKLNKLMRVSLALILSGAIGNFIDRLLLGYVRDMLYVSLIDFPVFNVADSALTIGCALLLIDVLFGEGRRLFDDGKKKEKGEDTQAEPESKDVPKHEHE